MRTPLLHIFRCYIANVMLLMLPASVHPQMTIVKNYTVNDGLPGTSTYGAFQDKYGYLWISGPEGLSRFDGRQFINYDLSDGIPAFNGGNIFQDSRQRLWLGTMTGMAQFKNNRFITYPASDSLSDLYVYHFLETKEKKVWVATGKGAYEFEDTVWKKLKLYPGFENNNCSKILELNGELYVVYLTKIFCKTRSGNWVHIASLQDGSFFNDMCVQDNKIWVSTKDNIYQVDNNRLIPVYKDGIRGEGYFSFFVDSKKRLWLSGKDFLRISKPGDFLHFSDSIINQYGYIVLIKEDFNHNIWIGTLKGLLKIKDLDFTIIDKNNASPLDGIYNIIPLPDNRMIFSSGAKTGLLMYDNKSCRQIVPPPGNSNYYRDPVDAYAFDEKNNLWMVTRFRKLLHFNGKTLKDFSGVLHPKTSEAIYDMAYSKKRRLFFICADSTLLYGNPSKLSAFIPHNTGIPIPKPIRIYETKNGLLLLFISGQGLYAIDSADNLISLINETGIDGSKKGIDWAVSFFEDARNTFWIAVPGRGLYEYGFSGKGLPFLKNLFTVKEGLQSNGILSLTNDRQNRLWVATNNGLDILQKTRAENWEIFNYASTDELTLNECEFEKLVTDPAGNVWLSSPDKILKFNPGNITLYKEAPHILIEKVSLAFKETDWSKLSDSLYSYFQLPYNPVLNYTQNSLGISFNAIDVSTSNSNPGYSYKLIPLDTSWSIPSKVKSVSFAQLPAGRYQFMVRVKDKASGWSRPAVFRFTITPPFWNRWWFRLIVIAIASYIIISIFRARIKKIKEDALVENQLKELEMKALKAQMNPHFIYNALNSIQALVANDKKTEGIRYIGSFSRLLRQVLDNSENNVISLDKELETIGLYIQLEALRLDIRLQYKKNVPESIVTEFEKIPPLILQPFVENALWHGLSRKEGDKEIKITVSEKKDWLICDITDNGIGRAKAQEWKSNSAVLHQSKGIDITRKRLIDFNEDKVVLPIEFFDLYDRDKNSTGTRVTVRIKRKTSLPPVIY